MPCSSILSPIKGLFSGPSSTSWLEVAWLGLLSIHHRFEVQALDLFIVESRQWQLTYGHVEEIQASKGAFAAILADRSASYLISAKSLCGMVDDIPYIMAVFRLGLQRFVLFIVFTALRVSDMARDLCGSIPFP